MEKTAAPRRKYSLRSKTPAGAGGDTGSSSPNTDAGTTTGDDSGMTTDMAEDPETNTTDVTDPDPVVADKCSSHGDYEDEECEYGDDGDDQYPPDPDCYHGDQYPPEPDVGGDQYPDNGAGGDNHHHGMGGGGCGSSACGAGGSDCHCSALACCLKGWTGWKVGRVEVAVFVGVAIYVGLAFVFWELFRGYFEWLESLAITVKYGFPRISVLDLFGSVLACHAYRSIARFPKHAVETLVACSLIQFGGTFLVGVLVLGQTPSWMSSFTAWPALVVAWWLTFFSPSDFWHCHVMRNEGVLFIAGFGRALSAAHAITSWGVDKALTAHYEKATMSAGCAILCGTLAGCGGGILADLLNLEGHSWNVQRTPTAFAKPSFSVQRCFGASCLYYILADPHGLLCDDAPYALTWLGTWSVSHGVGPSTEAAAIVALYVTANHLMDYFIPHYEDPLCKVFKLCLGCLGIHCTVSPKKKPACPKKKPVCPKKPKKKTH